jgi:multisubunit Na+/H+ antiporter MnhB subunit
MKSVILRAATRLLSGLVLVLSVYLLWRGHNLPGGGFIAALVAATGFALVVLTEGPKAVRGGLRIHPQQLVGVGLLVALCSGTLGLFRQHPFLTGVWWPAGKPIIGTPFLFDVGVFLVVLGAILTVLLALEDS